VVDDEDEEVVIEVKDKEEHAVGGVTQSTEMVGLGPEASQPHQFVSWASPDAPAPGNKSFVSWAEASWAGPGNTEVVGEMQVEVKEAVEMATEDSAEASLEGVLELVDEVVEETVVALGEGGVRAEVKKGMAVPSHEYQFVSWADPGAPAPGGILFASWAQASWAGKGTNGTQVDLVEEKTLGSAKGKTAGAMLEGALDLVDALFVSGEKPALEVD